MNTTLPKRPSKASPMSTALKEREHIDPYREWLDPESHPALLALMTSGELGSYHDAVSAIRSARPEDPHEATKWWAAPVNRAQLLNALLRRGSRAVVQVEAELNLPQGKAYSFLKYWRVRFRAHPTVHVSAIDPTKPEVTYPATVLEALEDKPGYARLKVPGLTTGTKLAGIVPGGTLPHQAGQR